MTFKSFLSTSAVLALTFSIGCTGESKDGFGISTGTGGDSDSEDTDIFDTDTDDPDDTDTDDTNQDTGMDTGEDTGDATDSSGESQTFDEPGDVVIVESSDGVATVDLTDASGDSNTDQDFYLIVVNTSEEEEEVGFALEYHLSAGEGNPAPETEASLPVAPHMSESQSQTSSSGNASSPVRRGKSSLLTGQSSGQTSSGQTPSGTTTGPVAPPSTYTSAHIGIARQDFKVRDSIDDETSYERTGAVLWAIGSSVSIWVDEAVAVDWDQNCDGTIDVPAATEAYGFDNCDLQQIADIVDYNIFPNLRGYFGDESDENGDGMVSVVITPVLNQMTRNTDEDSEIQFVSSYTDPTVDLAAFDPDQNPVSDEQEVIYVFAPDPYGYHNPYARTTIEDYTSVNLSAQIASAFYKLVSYNQHVILNESDEEDTWVSLGLSALAADLTGFGASNYIMAWNYLDAPHLSSLTETEDSGAISTSPFGGQYLFFRWLVDAYGDSVLSGLVQSADVGTENIENVVGEGMEDLVLKWQIALMSAESTQGDGGLAVDGGSYPPYAPTSTITAPTTSPTSGDLYGANGYQLGIDVGSDNVYMFGGTDVPVENEDSRVRLAHSDFSTAVFGQDFYGYVTPGYGAQVIRMTDIPFDATQIEVRSPSSAYKVAVIRGGDAPIVNFARDVLYSPTDVNNTILPMLPTDGNPIYGIGEISVEGATVTVDSDGSQSSQTVYDTDRWLVDLSSFTNGAPVRVVAWLDYRYEDISGTVGLSDPWMAMVPRSYVPVPTVAGTQTGACADGVSFGYPFMLLEHLYSQVLLSSTSYDESEMFSLEVEDTAGTTDVFDPCGTQEENVTTCDEDWDRDGVLDVNEPSPSTFIGQMQVMQCTLAGNDPSGFVPIGTEVLDLDQTDDDEAVSLDRKLNLGGVSVDEEEGAYLDLELTGGQQYILVVGSDGTGPYELTIKAVTE